MDKTLEHLKETLEDEIKKIVKKGDISPAELESVKNAVATIDMIENMGQSEGGYSNRRSSNRRSSYGGMYEDMDQYYRGRSNDQSEESYRMPYGGRIYYDADNRDSYRGDSYRGEGNRGGGGSRGGSYRGDSYERGRSPVTGRYISRGSYEDGYSGHSIKDRMVARLEGMYDEAQTEHERHTISKAIDKIQGEK